MRKFSIAQATLYAVWCLTPASISLQLPSPVQTKKSANPRRRHPSPLSPSSNNASSRNLASAITSLAPSSVAVEPLQEQTHITADTADRLAASTATSGLQKRTKLPQSSLNEPEIWKLALAGSIATLVSDVTMHPLDCIKTLQQTEQGIGLSMVAAAHCIYHTMGGLTGFTRGFLTWGVCDALGGALKFSTYEGLKRQLTVRQQQEAETTRQSITNVEENDDDNSSIALRNNIVFALAAVSFVASSIITVPGELLKQHLQMGHYPGTFEAVWHIVDTQGLSGLYTGYDGVLMRDTPYTALELGLYDVFKNLYLQHQRRQRVGTFSQDNNEDENDKQYELQTMEQTLIAGLTGGVAGLLTTPFDTVKTKATLDFVGCSFWDSAVLTIQGHGPEALFAGALARVAWLIPVTAIYLPTYDFIKTKIQEQHKYVQSKSRIPKS